PHIRLTSLINFCLIMMHRRVPNVKRRPLVSEAIPVMTIIDVIVLLRFSYNPRKKLRGQNENTAESHNCVRDLAFDSHRAASYRACSWAMGESSCRRNSAWARW